MSAALPLFVDELTPFVMKQAEIRASRCITKFGLHAGDWEDLRQDLVLDCLRRLDHFDPTRGDWRPFVVGVIRNRSLKLLGRVTKQAGLGTASYIGSDAPEEGEPASDCFGPDLDLRLDVSKVLSTLPAEVKETAALLARYSPNTVRLHSKLTVAEFERRLRRIRAAFVAAGIDGRVGFDQGGAR